MTVSVSPLAYALWCAGAVVVTVAGCASARRRPGPWVRVAQVALGAVLVGEQVSWQLAFVLHHAWSVRRSLPLDLCDLTALVAAVACWWEVPAAVELTWMWGLLGTLQAVITPDVGAAWPHLGFVNYVVEHLGIVAAALWLVVGRRLAPRPGSARRVFAVTLAYAGVVGLVDVATGADYLFLRSPPAASSLLDLLGPWPWYLVGCATIAAAGFTLLDLPFHRDGWWRPGPGGRPRRGRPATGARSPGRTGR